MWSGFLKKNHMSHRPLEEVIARLVTALRRLAIL